MPLYKKTVHDLKRDHLQKIYRTLSAVKSGEIESPSDAHDFTPASIMMPKFYIELDFYRKDDTHRKGYVLSVDPMSMEITGGKFFMQHGYGTYQECELHAEDIASIKKYFSLPNIQEIIIPLYFGASVSPN
jgi:hypothetical protein